MDNSPSQLIVRTDIHRPLVLVSSSGTRVIHEAAGCEATYLGCFRNHSILAAYLAARHPRVAVIGAGIGRLALSKRPTDLRRLQACAAVGQSLLMRAYEEALGGQVLVGAPDTITERLRMLQEEIGIDGILAEINCGGLIPHEQVMTALRLLCEEVKPRFH